MQKTIVIINYREANADIRNVMDITKYAIGLSRIYKNTYSMIGINGLLTNEEKEYIQKETGGINHCDYIFVELDEDEDIDGRGDTINLISDNGKE